MSVHESGQVSSVDVCSSTPHLVAVTASAKVQLFDPARSQVEPLKTLTKFRSPCFGARVRRDGKLLSVGAEDGAVRIFDVATKTQLRCFEGHKRATKRLEFCRIKILFYLIS